MAGDTIRIRMYAVGFGDCFLIGFPAPDHERLVLIDCGVHNASLRGADLRTAVIPDILKEASAATGSPHLDVVVATHHHLDHVAGFKFEGWDEVDVGEVWLPWTEDPNDPDAQRIRAAQSRQASLLLALDPTKDKEWETVRAISENNVGYTNGPAMTTLHDGFAGHPPRFFLPEAPAGPAQPGQSPGGAGDPARPPRQRRFRPPALPGVEVVVLGPSRDEAAIRDMNPPDKQSYFRLAGGRKQTGGKRQVAQGGDSLPFTPLSQAEIAADKEFAKLIPKRSSDLGAIVNAGHTDALALAVALEQATNGTSLMLLFRVGDTAMLFPGDAQWGTWDRVLHDPEGEDLLRSVNFYKVGHHGSHNATPVSFVETYLHGADASMVSVGPTSIPSWGDIPRKPLLTALGAPDKSAILLDSDDLREAARAGKPAPADPAVTVAPDGLWTEIRLPVVRTGP